MKIFLSHSFSQEEDKTLATAIGSLLESHNVDVFTGKRLGGEALTPAVKRKIDKSDALVALLTRREEIVSGGWRTHPWVLDELNYARNQNKLAIAIREEGVEVGGMYGEQEYILLNREQFLSTILDLSKTIGIWKQELGRIVKVKIICEDNAIGINDFETKCSYRFIEEGEYFDWQTTNLIPEVGGTFAYIKGVQEQYMIQLKMEIKNETWVSCITPQWMPFQLKRQETDR